MGNVYEACSKEETKTQYHFSINATVMGDSSLMELTNKELLVKKRELQKQQHHTD